MYQKISLKFFFFYVSEKKVNTYFFFSFLNKFYFKIRFIEKNLNIFLKKKFIFLIFNIYYLMIYIMVSSIYNSHSLNNLLDIWCNLNIDLFHNNLIIFLRIKRNYIKKKKELINFTHFSTNISCQYFDYYFNK
jgi:hypothetical protein